MVMNDDVRVFHRLWLAALPGYVLVEASGEEEARTKLKDYLSAVRMADDVDNTDLAHFEPAPYPIFLAL